MAVTLIAVFEVPWEVVDRFLAEWNEDKDFMIRQPGFIDGTLYRSAQTDAHFRFVNVARWEREDDWRDALRAGYEERRERGIDRMADWQARGITVTATVYDPALQY
ncbi:hypothetical protein KBTX_01662 [wastewater metagenome]|uniref:ABM domain-containing protein n=2 Tax=unclassified sequences TaxID=12908 RepID=A0A5B8RD26_9ZZZZ|nr:MULTISPECIES: antibiotic biosynthesis monooxygenase [Arhodomonas]MCS4506002.1 antibiotic biosynthesis monooxygenase [Arhodomonas aquaeolei]QEA05342.1 hypothetical protein KBTEX_01662 [uncultured organism]